MRIDLQNGPQQAAETSLNPKDTTAANSSTATQAQGLGFGEDQAQLSGAHVQVASLAAQALQLPEVREERVASLRQAVAGGHYRPLPEKVAHAVLAHMIGKAAA
jgi:flagellar biosynthesis anti-sigma factor FlgM